MTTVAPSVWTAYFAAQHALRIEYERKIDLVERKYAEMPPTADPMEGMTRIGRMTAEIAALSDECEGKIAEIPYPVSAEKECL